MLNTTRNKCCVRAYTTYLNINFLIMHPYIVHTKNKLFKNYTTFENIYIYITQHMTNTVHYIWQNITQHMKTNSTTYDTHYNANWWGAMYKVSGQRDEHGRSGDFREWDFVIKRLIYKQFCWTRAGFTTLHGLVPTSTLVPQIYIAFAPRTKGRLYVPPCGRWLVKMVSSDFRSWASTLKTHSHKMPWHDLEMSRIIWLRTSARELHKIRTNESHIRLFVYDTKARWCCPLHHPSSTAFVSKSSNHWTTCWILPKAGPKAWSPKVLSRWRSWVGLGVCLLKKSASVSAVFLKGAAALPNSTCCLQKCFLISMCLVAGLLDGCRPIVIAAIFCFLTAQAGRLA